MPRMFIHPSVTTDRVIAAVESYLTTLDNPGFCLSCGQDACGVEPDAEGYECESCGELSVMGAELLLIHIV